MEANLNKFIIKKAGSLILAATFVLNIPFSLNVEKVLAAVSNKKAQEIKKELQPIIETVDQLYYEKVDTTKMLNEVLESENDETDVDSIAKKFVKKLNDPYSEYYTAKELESFSQSLKGEYYGIGVEIAKDEKTGGIRINNVFDGSPAKKAKLKKGDIILKAGKKDLTKLELTEASKYVKGAKGSKITLTILRDGITKKIAVERNEVVIPSVFSKTYNKGKIGYIRVSGFLEKTADEFIKALDKLEQKGISGLVIDLRNNGGGLVDAAHKMLDRILPDGEEIYSFSYKGGNKDYYKTGIDGKQFIGQKRRENDRTFDLPIMILMNGNSASASELFAGALKDNLYAEIVGEVSYGKGVAQSVIEIRDKNNLTIKGGLKLTTIKYYLPNGESINMTGINPDYKVEEDMNTVKDEQLEKAFQVLNEMID